MKTISSRFPRSKRGMALISVLAVLLLLTLLVVAFLAKTTSARSASASFTATANTRLLADMAVNMVQAQINEATTVGLTSTGTLSGSASYTWGSQPGAIRVYKNNGATTPLGTLAYVYRLYSATPTTASTARLINVSSQNDPAATTSALAALAADLPSTSATSTTSWNNMGAQWVDLNGFVQDSEGKYHFPIVDPRDPNAVLTQNPTNVATLWQPAGSNPPLYGFSVQPPATVGNSVNPAPMPVRWLYVLKDGSIVSPDNPQNPSNQLTFQNAVNAAGAADIPSVSNPIVGRIAFWTDDDSSKININTAAGDDVVRGSNSFAANSIFWATPMYSSPDDALMAQLQPVNGEIQRYSGHPGTVGLNTTLSTLLGLKTPLSYSDFYSLLPRYTGGGSTSATVYTPYNGTNPPALALTANRLYTSIGEMLFQATSTSGKRNEASFITDNTTTEVAAADAVERASFFLTAHSASSELNLYGEPRISIWPYTTKTGGQTLTDQLLAFDSTIQHAADGTTDNYYFQRTSPLSTSIDCSIANNVNIFNYLDGLTGGGASIPIPGFGSNFTAHKYPNPAMRQIISEIFDYVRTINMVDPLLYAQNTSGKYTYGQPWGNAGQSLSGANGGGAYQVEPSSNNGKGLNGWGVQGLGAYPIPVDVTLDFVALGLGAKPAVASQHFGLQAAKDIPLQQYAWPYLAHDTSAVSYSCDNISNDTSNGNAGLPSPMSTAMQCFIYVSFVNPGLIESTSQPVFCFSLQATTPLKVQGYVDAGNGQLLPKPYPGYINPNVAQTTPPQPASPAEPTVGVPPTPAITLDFPGCNGYSNPESFSIVDQTDGAGFLNGWIGDWMFGYIPSAGETGNNNYGSNPAMLMPTVASPSAQPNTWSISGNTPLASASNLTQYRSFPFYSQIFGLPGEGSGPLSGTGWSTKQGNPNVNGVFSFLGGTLVLKMYDYSQQGQSVTASSSHVISTYTITFPSSGTQSVSYTNGNGVTTPEVIPTMWLPTYSASDSQVIGTLGNGGSAGPGVDRWHYALDGNSGNGYNITHISPNDTVQGMVLSPAWSDARDLAQSTVSASAFTSHPNWSNANSYSGTVGVNASGQSANLAHDMMEDSTAPFVGNNNPTYWGVLVKGASYSNPYSGNYPIVPPTLNGPSGQGAYTTTGAPGDWDNGVAWFPDGPWDNMPDEGVLVTNTQNGGQSNSVAYYSTGNLGQRGEVSTVFSPNREIPSPAMFGSLPTGISATNPQPWQTLLFRPGAGAGGFGKYHPGEKNQPQAGDPPDHLLLDLFWMPQAEPYPISQPFVTEGKINLNYEIQPFTYITRDTALRALLGSEEIAVMPDSLSPYYKIAGVATGAYGSVTAAQITTATGSMDVNGNGRLPIDPDQTLGLNPSPASDPHAPTSGTGTTNTAQTGSNAWYDSSAKTTRFFRSASELCEMFLVPKYYDWQDFTGASGTLNKHAWYKIPGGDFALVGDNTRERPYVDLYSRVTTKSNTYTVYYTVQSLKNAEPATNAGQAMWDETKGSVTGEYRGSSIIERYIDPNEQTIPDFLNTSTTTPGSVSLEAYYKWRVIETRQFAP